MKRFLDVLAEGVFLADGAMGTEILSRGIPFSRCYPELNLSNPALIRKIHVSYIQAGAQVIETNTFSANAVGLKPYGLEDKTREINFRGAKIAREATAGKGYVAGSVGPIGREARDINPSKLFDMFAVQAEALAEGGVDLILLETFSNLEETAIAFRAARNASNLPVLVQFSLSFSKGTPVLSPEEAVRTAEDWGGDVVGINCGSGPEETLAHIERMRAVSSVKLSAMPSAGLPQASEGVPVYPETPESMAKYARRLVRAGASLIGGCCGTTPEIIREMVKELKGFTL